MRTFSTAICIWLTLAAALASAAEPRFVKAWGSEGTEDGEFEFCIGIAIYDQALFVTDHYNNRVQKFDFEGRHLISIPVLPHPGGIAADQDGNLFIAHFPASGRNDETQEDRISVYEAQGNFIREFGKSGSGDGELSWPGGVAIGPDDRVYVADQTNRRVQVFDKDGKFVAKFGEYGTGPGQFGGTTNPKSRVGGPQLLAFDRDGNLYTTEGMICRVQKLTRDGKPLLMWGSGKDEPGHFGGKFTGFKDRPANLEGPIGIAVDADNHVWVASINGRIQEFDTEGKLLGGIQSGQGTEPGKFLAPHGIALNAAGELFVVDSYNHRIQKFATR
jgi:DNA-binding beta-propeller fold protein YncE